MPHCCPLNDLNTSDWRSHYLPTVPPWGPSSYLTHGLGGGNLRSNSAMPVETKENPWTQPLPVQCLKTLSATFLLWLWTYSNGTLRRRRCLKADSLFFHCAESWSKLMFTMGWQLASAAHQSHRWKVQLRVSQEQNSSLLLVRSLIKPCSICVYHMQLRLPSQLTNFLSFVNTALKKCTVTTTWSTSSEQMLHKTTWRHRCMFFPSDWSFACFRFAA